MARSKRKSKKKKINQQQLEAQRKNEYKRKIIRLARLVGAEEALTWIPKKDWEWLCNVRFRAVRVEAGNDLVPKQLLSTARKQLDFFLADGKITFENSRYEMSYKEYLLVALRVYFYVTDEENPCPIIVREKFAKLIEAVESEDCSPPNILLATSTLVTMQISRIHRRMYYFRYKIELHDGHMNECLYLYGFQHHKRKLKVRDASRLAYRVGWGVADRGTVWSQVTGRQFGFDNKLADLPVRVYIQAHALQRLKERVDVINTSLLHFHLYESLEDLKVVRSNSGQLLIEYRYVDKKLGYLVIDLLGKNLVIRTFLFITMDGTPEGEILRETLGIEAEDKKYLAIDKLSTFIVSDIKNNPEVKQHFIDAGCGHLFEWEGVDLSTIVETEQAAVIHSYLQKAKEIREHIETDEQIEAANNVPHLPLLEAEETLLLPQSISA